MSIIVYGRSNSINVQKTLWLLEELGADFERRDVGGPFGFPDGFERLSPLRQIPAIRSDGASAWESNTVLRLLARQHQAEGLYPPDLQRRAAVEAWMDWQLMAIGLPMRRVFRKTIRGDGAYAPADLQELTEAMRAIGAALRPSGHLLGQELTLADLAIAPFVHRWLELPIDKPAIAPLADWRARLRARPGFARHVDKPLS